MPTYSIQSTQEILQLVDSDFNEKFTLKEKHLYFIDTLIRNRADKKSKYLSSELLKRTFGDRTYKLIIDYFIEKGIVERQLNYQDGRYPYYTYTLLASVKNLIQYEITSNSLINTINFFLNTNYSRLNEIEKQVLFNIEKLQLPSAIERPKLYITKSPNTGRLFHTLTSLKREHRMYLKHIDGHELVEIDGKGAQLVMLSNRYNDDEVFNDAVYSGEIYQIIANEIGVDISSDVARNKFKKQFFNSVIFNQNPSVICNSKYGIAFMNLFPITFQHLNDIDVNTSKAKELQRQESELFINNITRDLVKKSHFVVPIHDALVVFKKDVDAVMKIINDNCFAFLGRLMSFSTKEFCPTPYPNCTTYINIYSKEEEKEDTQHTGVYVVQNTIRVGQNKNNIVRDEKIEVITEAIKTLLSENKKVTIRKVQEVSGVAKSTVEKHYKQILNNLI
jgi:predicted transcriptional regulator